MLRELDHFRRFVMILCCAFSACVGFVLARYSYGGKIELSDNVVQPSYPTPAELVRQAHRAHECEAESLKQLLAWLIDLSTKQDVNLDAVTRDVVHHSIIAFGDARYEPATDFLLSELIERRVPWRMPPPPLVVSEPKSFLDTNPHLQALVKIGGPTMPQRLLKLFLSSRATVRKLLKAPGSEESGRYRMWALGLDNGLMEALATKPMIAEAIDQVNKHLFAADQFVDRESLDDLLELKKYLLEHLPK